VGKGPVSLIAAILDADPPAISSLQAMSPAVLDHVVKKCLAKECYERWQIAQAVASGNCPYKKSKSTSRGRKHVSQLVYREDWAKCRVVHGLRRRSTTTRRLRIFCRHSILCWHLIG
jgi:hypothetical protein